MTILKEVQTKISELPALSPSVTELLGVLNEDAEDALAKVGKIVESDPTLAAIVLKAANSASMGLRYDITSPARAVTILGIKMISSIAIGASAGDLYSGNSHNSSRNEFWQHSLYCAIVSRCLSDYCKKSVLPSIAYTAGLLHDIGKALLAEYVETHRSEINDFVRQTGIRDYLIIENELFGINHALAGAMLAQAWSLPGEYLEVIRWHHFPSSAREDLQDLVYLVHLADLIAMWTGHTTLHDAMLYEFDHASGEYFNIESPRIEKILSQSEIEFSKTLATLESLEF